MINRDKIISFLKANPSIVRFVWRGARYFMRVIGFIVPIQQKTMIFCCFGGRKYDDSPKAIYDEVCKRKFFNGWRLIWAFNSPEKFKIPRGEKIRVDSLTFFLRLLQSKVWVSNSGMDRGIGLKRKCTIRVETWHGTPLKKILGDQNQNSIGGRVLPKDFSIDKDTIRCAQSEFDREIFVRLFHADKSAILLCDLPRNDELVHYSTKDVINIKSRIGIPEGKQVILYAPTYREYLVDDNYKTFISPPVDLNKWERELAADYVLLVRVHYAVSAALNIKTNEFVKDVSDYPFINDLYLVSDILISDYSSSYIDYSILNRPMMCFAYDQDEYMEKRGLYVDLEKELPCSIDKNEDALLEHIKGLDYAKASENTKKFHLKYAPFAGNASKIVVDKVISKLKTV